MNNKNVASVTAEPCICQDDIITVASGLVVGRVRLQQDSPDVSDDVVAVALLGVPAQEDDDGKLYIDEFNFIDVEIFGQKLVYFCGKEINKLHQKLCELVSKLCPPKYRWGLREFKAPTWHKAMEAAWKYALQEARKLERRMDERKKALIAADNCPLCKLQSTAC